MNPIDYQTIQCPYCGECFEVLLDSSMLGEEYIEDCQVCCRPIYFFMTEESGELAVSVRTEND
ncbi:CPXCG motif-containing cysteine-rich protein [Litoribrevibacter euphylliae]|uniref:CPXCG motif-containing cysteine-rich protein n=1 Tax=Litoribrevibacter euphylliae TaxID=1834034 RepID=A0ABV7HGW3_9GAMM